MSLPFPPSTKRLIVDVIRFQPGETLTEILETPATYEQVKLRGLTWTLTRQRDAPGMGGTQVTRGGDWGWTEGSGG